MFLSLISLFCIVILAMMLPGPDFFIVLRSSLRYGRFSGFLVTLGIASGSLIYATLAIVLLDYLREHFLFIMHWISLFGGCYLLYMAYNCYRASKNKPVLHESDTCSISISNRHLYLSGLLCNLTNPKAIVFFLSVLPMFILKCPSFWCHFIIILIVFSTSIIWFGFVSCVMGSNRIRTMFTEYMPKLDIVFSLILSIFAIYLIYSFIAKIWS